MAGESKLWVYYRESNGYLRQPPREIALEGHLYSLNEPEAQAHRFAIESALARLEGRAAAALTKLRHAKSITQDEHNAISELLGYQVVRTPEFLKIIQEMSRRLGQETLETYVRRMVALPRAEFEQRVARYERQAGRRSAVTQQDLVTALERGMNIVPSQDAHLAIMVELGATLGIEFSGRRWRVVHVPDYTYFLGSDRAVLQQRIYTDKGMIRLGAAAPGVMNLFVFSPDTALLVSDEPSPTIEHICFAAITVSEVNDQLAQESTRLIFSHSRDLLESVAERNQLTLYRPRMAVNEALIRAMAESIVLGVLVRNGPPASDMAPPTA